MDQRGEALWRLVEVVDRLRDECPWDREQTFASMVPCVQEEAAELADAVALGRPPLMREELGDLLMNVFLLARIGEQAGEFDLAHVAEEIREKLIRRHPHVFGDVEVEGADQVLANWDRIKAAEEKPAAEARQSAMDGIPERLSAIGRATKMMQRAARAGFDWPSDEHAFDKVEEELAEVQAARAEGGARLEEEVGDLLLAIVTAAGRLRVDPELALRRACQRFDRRYRRMEELHGADFQDLAIVDLERLWRRAREGESAGP